jgi:hypothetical protein
MREGSETAAIRERSETSNYKAGRGELERPDDQCEPPARLAPQPRFETVTRNRTSQRSPPIAASAHEEADACETGHSEDNPIVEPPALATAANFNDRHEHAEDGDNPDRQKDGPVEQKDELR